MLSSQKITALVVAVGALLVVGTIGLMSSVGAANDNSKAKSNQAAEFTLTDPSGKSHSLSDYKGKWVVLEWTNQSCPFVKKFYSVGNMQELQKKYTEKGVVWLAICSSAKGKQGHFSSEEWASTIKKNELHSTAVLIDEDGKVGKLYKAKTTPHMFVINPEGEIVYQGAIDSKKSADSDDIANSDNYVVAALEAGMAGKPIKVKTTQPYGCSVKY